MELNVISYLFGLELASVTNHVIYQCNASCSNTTKPIVFTIYYSTVRKDFSNKTIFTILVIINTRQR